MIYIDTTPPPAIVCQLTDEQQAAAYRDRIKQDGANFARDQIRSAREQAKQASIQGQATVSANESPRSGPQGEPKPKPTPTTTNVFHR